MTERALYNEFDDYPADWIENLVAIGAIAPGIVDRRSVEDLRPDELGGFRQVHLFAGIAVWSYALRCAGVPDDAPVWTLSCPCQPFSAAGKGAGVDDERHLWPAAYHLIRECRPDVILGEQVASKDGLDWLDIVFADLQAASYAIGPVDTCSAGVGAPHIRQRLRFCAYNLRSSASWLQHASGDGRKQRWAEPVRRRAAGGCSIDRVAHTERAREQRDSTSCAEGASQGSRGWQPDPNSAGSSERLDHHHHQGLEGQWDGHRTSTGQWSGQVRPVAPAGGVVRMADDEGITGRPGLRDSGEAWIRVAFLSHGGAVRSQSNRPGPTNGPWRDADWLFCRDGKWRPVVASHVEMVDGITTSVGRSGPFDAEESKTRLQAMLDTFGEEEIQRQAGRQWSFSEESVLRPHLHGRLDGGADQEPDSAEQSETICQDCRDHVRSVSGDGGGISCASCGRKPIEQRSLELEDIVRQLPQSLSLAKLYGRRESAERLYLLQRAIDEEGALLHPPVTGEATWASLGEDAKDRIRMGFDVGAWKQVVSFPLVNGDDFKPGSGRTFEGKSRQGMLKGYGNAVDAEATRAFIEDCIAFFAHLGTGSMTNSTLEDLL